MELETARDSYCAAIQGNRIHGYIQQLGFYPFNVVFYTEEQLSTYIAACKATDSTTLHADTTGAVVSCVPGQHKCYYYCFLLASKNLPVMEAITTWHTTQWLLSLLLLGFNSSMRILNNGKLLTPCHVVTDFSYALMYVCIAAFNGGMRLSAYLGLTFRIINSQATLSQIMSTILFCHCASHTC